ncbi:MAG TPA: diaminopimelate decarboxylase [Candidatus Dormibacteraeota bacterium]|nr:diaminopimelate decarboxylase [Candidatus Dormibacteraeota bacterium]
MPLLDPTRYTPFFHYREGRLHVEGVPLDRVAGRVGTPAYVYSRAGIETAWRRFDSALAAAPHLVCYSLKANSNLSIVKRLARLGSGFDIVSGGELDRLRRAGVPGDRVVFSGVGKTREEIRDALRAGILLFNVESEAELEVLAEEASRRRQVAPAALRVNPDVGAGAHPHISTGRRVHKFGVEWDRALAVYRAGLAMPSIRWRGVTSHIGSQILSLDPFRRALGRLAVLVGKLRREGVNIEYLDIGGGLGVRYANENPPDFGSYGKLLVGVARRLNCCMLVEPGRSIVGPAGILLTRVVYRKENRGKTFLVVDAGMNDLMRPALYGAVHPVTTARRPARRGRRMQADIVGPVCETGDAFVADWPMPDVGAGELLVIWGAGAYGFSLSSSYNARPRPAEVLIEGSRFRVIRRRETYADLVRGE